MVTQVVPFFGVTNMEQSLKFYVDGLGFAMKNKWTPRGTIEWCWLDLGAASIMLQELLEGRRPEGTLGAGMSICFMSDDAVGYYRELSARGIVATEPFVGNNMWVIGVTDPDGYRLFFESPTDVPEETKLSEVTK
jgi:catechol 2,3-dioxygenase-like lactoylglutathione lyase family enzyme